MLYLQRPFLITVEHLTEDVVMVFEVADSLEEYVMDLIVSSCGGGESKVMLNNLDPFKVLCSVFMYVCIYLEGSDCFFLQRSFSYTRLKQYLKH